MRKICAVGLGLACGFSMLLVGCGSSETVSEPVSDTKSAVVFTKSNSAVTSSVKESKDDDCPTCGSEKKETSNKSSESEKKAEDVKSTPVDVPRVDVDCSYDEDAVKKALGDEFARVGIKAFSNPEISSGHVSQSTSSITADVFDGSKTFNSDKLDWNYVFKQGEATIVAHVTCYAYDDADDMVTAVVKPYFANSDDIKSTNIPSDGKVDSKLFGGMHVDASPRPDGKWEIVLSGTLRSGSSAIVESLPTLTINDFCVKPEVESYSDNASFLHYRFIIDVKDKISAKWRGETASITLEEAKNGFGDPYVGLGMEPKAAANSVADAVANAINIKRVVIGGAVDRALAEDNIVVDNNYKD